MTRRNFLRLACVASCGVLAACGAAPPPAAPASSAAATVTAGKPAASAPAKPSPSGGLKLSVVYTTPVATNMSVWMGEAVHAFSDRHLTVDFRSVDGSLATKAMVAGEMDVLLQGAIAMIAAKLNGGIDLVYIASEVNHSAAALNVAPAIKSVADLKGKVIGSDQLGTISEYQILSMLAEIGLRPSDVILRPLGGSAVRVTSLLAGQVQAAGLNPPFSFQAEAQGYKLLANLYKPPVLDLGAVVLRSRVDELAPALVPFVEGCRDGVRAYNTQPELAIKVMQQYTKESDPDILRKTYELYKNSVPFQEDQQPSLESIKAMLDYLGNSTIPAAKTAKAEDFVDTRILSRMAKA